MQQLQYCTVFLQDQPTCLSASASISMSSPTNPLPEDSIPPPLGITETGVDWATRGNSRDTTAGADRTPCGSFHFLVKMFVSLDSVSLPSLSGQPPKLRGSPRHSNPTHVRCCTLAPQIQNGQDLRSRLPAQSSSRNCSHLRLTTPGNTSPVSKQLIVARPVWTPYSTTHAPCYNVSTGCLRLRPSSSTPKTPSTMLTGIQCCVFTPLTSLRSPVSST